MDNKENLMPWGWIVLALPVIFAWGYYDTQKDVSMLAEGQRIIYSNQIEIMRELEEQRRTAPRGPAIEIVPEPTPRAQPRVEPRKAPTKDLRVVKTRQQIPHKNIDLFCMAKNIFHEAGVEDRLGKYAVAQVTLNRMKNSRYPNDVCEVVMQPFQFSWANDRKVRWKHPKGPLWEEAKKIAEDVIKNGARVRGLENALFYHADYVKPRWKDPEAKIARVGTHIFYASAR